MPNSVESVESAAPGWARPGRGTAAGLLALVLALAPSLQACGGGGGGGGGGSPPVSPPAGLVYAQPSATYEAEVAIAPNAPSSTGGAVASYSVLPSLPAGLALDASSGVISGTAASMTPSAVYTVKATNAGGSATAQVTIGVTLNQGDDMSPKDPATFTDDDIRYFMGRTQFGGTDALFQAIKGMGIPAYVDQMVTFTADPTLDAACDALLVNSTDPAGLEGKFPSQSQLEQYWLHYMTRTSNPFQEVLAFFWHDHFAASDTVLDGSMNYWVKAHINLFRLQGNGNLRPFLVNVARDWLMLEWLNGDQSTKAAPNENFAREFWELFTLGVDNGYTQADIVQSAKALTGYRVTFDGSTNLDGMTFDTSRHDPGSKTILGHTIAAQNTGDDYQAVVDITLDNRQVAEFISKCLFEYFCFKGPKTIPTDAMAATLRGAGYELKPLLQALFKSKAFFSQKSRAGLVKGQVDHVVGFIRSTGLLTNEPNLANNLAAAGQVPTQPPTVNGWPQGELLLSAQGMLDRANIVNSIIRDRAFQTGLGINPKSLLPQPVPPATSPTSAAVVDTLCDLLHVSASASEKATYATYLDTDVSSPGGAPFADPFDWNNATHIDKKVRGLLYMLSQHPTYAVK